MLVNTRAVDLGLGSGGFDVLYANLTRGLNLPADEGAHVMALPYAPGQIAVRFAEEDGVSRERIDDLPGRLHGSPQPARAGLRGARGAPRHVRPAVGRGAARVAVGHRSRAQGPPAARHGDRRLALRRRRLQCVTAASATDARGGARRRRRGLRDRPGHRRHGIAMGPRRPRGRRRGEHGGRARGEADRRSARLVRRRAAPPPRASPTTRGRRSRSASTRCRSRGRGGSSRPRGSTSSRWTSTGWEAACAPLPLSHMGRGPAEDPWFFAAAFAAGRLAVA